MSDRRNRSAGLSASGFFVLRTPLLPFTELEEWGARLEAAAHAESDGLDAALARDRDRLRERLRELVARPEFRDALFVASPTLEAAIEQWEKNPESERGRTTEEALVAYVSRAAARPTPFGLFAGSTTGTIGGQAALRLGGIAQYRRHSRLDMEYLSLVADAVERDPSIRPRLVYRPNSSLYEIGGRYHYAERRQSAGGRSYDLVAVDKTPYLAETLSRADGGATIATLAAALVDDDVTQADAEEFVGELVVSQLLTSDVGPRLTGAQPTDALVEALARHEETAPLSAALRDAQSRLVALDDGGVGAPPEGYGDVASALAPLPVQQADLSRLVQVDLMKPAPGVALPTAVTKEAARAVRILHAFSPVGVGDPLTRFRDEFTRRYETREVPLVEALDEEHGIGFDRSNAVVDDMPPLLRGIPLARGGEDGLRWTFRDRLLLTRLTDALAAGASEIQLDEADVRTAESVERPPLPDAFEVVAALEADSAEAVDRGDFRLYVHSASGPPAARLLGRFCYADEALHELVRGNLRAEEGDRRGPVFAEIVHLPEGRVGNILSRPVLRDHEIPYLGLSGASSDRQIPVSDLLVSVENGAIVLRSRRLGREVVPRLTTAHNYSRRSLRVYRFLCALQSQGVLQGAMWHWGPLEATRFLPRVVSGRTVLSRARWNLDHDDLAAFRATPGVERFAAVQRLRSARSLPRWVSLADGDNELVVDLDNALSIDAVARQVRRRPGAALVELFPAPERLCVAGPEGRFTNQLVIPFVRNRDGDRTVAARIPVRVERRFPPGSEWLYARLYTGPATTDLVLDRAARAVHGSLASGGADRWFFIRYSDPDWHLRLRVHGTPERLVAETLPTLHAALAPLIDSGRVWRMQMDTYEREVERYGGDRGVLLSEDVFHADSDAALEIVRALGGAESDVRWRAALVGIHLLLDDFSLTLEEKRDVARRACHGYALEFGAGKAFQREISRRYREERAALEALVDTRADPPPAFAPLVAALQRRSQRVRPVAEELRRLARAEELTQTVPELVMSFAHMHVNRLLRSAHRAQELVVYEFLARAYSSQAARR